MTSLVGAHSNPRVSPEQKSVSPELKAGKYTLGMEFTGRA